MSNPVIKTNNDPNYLTLKIELRLLALPDKKDIYILDAFGGMGTLWEEVKKRTDKNVKVLSIDKNKYSKINLIGDNLKFVKGLDLSKYDIIDLDAWGSPFKLLKIVFENKYKGIVICTFIQTIMGSIDKDLLISLNYTEKMYKKCRTILFKNAMTKLEGYLFEKGIKKITGVFANKKNYFYFIIH
jgi:Leucine-rich repeat (LRR) protein